MSLNLVWSKLLRLQSGVGNMRLAVLCTMNGSWEGPQAEGPERSQLNNKEFDADNPRWKWGGGVVVGD